MNLNFDVNRPLPTFNNDVPNPPNFAPFQGEGRNFDGEILNPLQNDPIFSDDPIWRKVVTAIPVVCYVMQIVNIFWIRHQDGLIEADPNDQDEKRAHLVQKAICYERCAAIGQVVTMAVIGIFSMMAVNPVTLTLVGLAFMGSMIAVMLTRNRISHMREHGELHSCFQNS